MEMSIVEKVMLDRISSRQNKLSDFYDIFSYDIIEKEVEEICEAKRIKNEQSVINLLDIMIVGNYLMINKKLSNDELIEFVGYIASEFPRNIEYQEYVDVLDSIVDYIKVDVSHLNKKIKTMKSCEKSEKQANNINKKKKEMIARQEELIVKRGYFKISLEEMQNIKKCLLQKSNPFHNKKYLLWKKHLKMNNEYEPEIEEKIVDPEVLEMKEHLKAFSQLIEDDSLTLEEMIMHVYELSNMYLKDAELRDSVKDIISKLKSKINKIDSDLKKTKKHVKNLIKQEIESSEYRYLDLSQLGEFIKERNELKNLLDILENVRKNSIISSVSLRYLVRSNANRALQEREDKSLNILKQDLYKFDYLDADIDGEETVDFLGTKNEQQDLLLIRDNTLKAYEKYEGKNPINAFFVSSFDDNYVYSVEKSRGKIIVRMHVQNIYPFLTNRTKSFLYSDFYKSLSDEYEKDDFLLKSCVKTYKFKDDMEMRPTIAYKFTYDENLHLESFDIEKMDAIVRKAKDEELKYLSEIFNKNRGNAYMIDLYFQNLLLSESIKYFKEHDIPVLVYAKPRDEFNGCYSKIRKKGCEVLSTENQEKLQDMLDDVDRNTFDSIGARLYKNYRRKHLSMTFDDNNDYRIDEISIINPFSFLGHNLEKLINQLIFDEVENKDEVRKNIKKEQEKYVAMFNSLCKYIDENELVDIVKESYQKVLAKEKNK